MSRFGTPSPHADNWRVGERQLRNLEVVLAFYAAGPAQNDVERRRHFAGSFVWHVPGDTDLSGDYAGVDYFERMPVRMAPLEEFSIDIEHSGANRDLVVTEGRIRGRRLGRELDVRGGHVFRLDADSCIVEAWGWCDDQAALDAFFA